METLLAGMTWWHWLALALVLFGVEMVTGTFDLLMASIGAVITAVFAALAPAGLSGWQGQLMVFIITAPVLILASRAFFPSLRRVIPDHPSLNRRMEQMLGQPCQATLDFSGPSGQVKIGDTVWMARIAKDQGDVHSGDRLIVEGFEANMVIVRKA